MSEVCFNFYPVLIGNEVLEEKLGYYAEEFLKIKNDIALHFKYRMDQINGRVERALAALRFELKISSYNFV